MRITLKKHKTMTFLLRKFVENAIVHIGIDIRGGALIIEKHLYFQQLLPPFAPTNILI